MFLLLRLFLCEAAAFGSRENWSRGLLFGPCCRCFLFPRRLTTSGFGLAGLAASLRTGSVFSCFGALEEVRQDVLLEGFPCLC